MRLHRDKDHPSISSEMVKFVCYSQPTANFSEFLTRFNSVESMQSGDTSKESGIMEGGFRQTLKKIERKAGV